METKQLIENAKIAVKNQRNIAKLIDSYPQHVTEFKSGKRKANWRIRGKLRAIAGEDPGIAMLDEIRMELENSENKYEKKAASKFEKMLAALDDNWRKRRDSNPR